MKNASSNPRSMRLRCVDLPAVRRLPSASVRTHLQILGKETSCTDTNHPAQSCSLSQEKDHISVRFVRKRLNTSTTCSEHSRLHSGESPISVINVAALLTLGLYSHFMNPQVFLLQSGRERRAGEKRRKRERERGTWSPPGLLIDPGLLAGILLRVL